MATLKVFAPWLSFLQTIFQLFLTICCLSLHSGELNYSWFMQCIKINNGDLLNFHMCLCGHPQLLILIIVTLAINYLYSQFQNVAFMITKMQSYVPSTIVNQRTICWISIIIQLWMNLNRVNIWFQLGNQFQRKIDNF